MNHRIIAALVLGTLAGPGTHAQSMDAAQRPAQARPAVKATAEAPAVEVSHTIDLGLFENAAELLAEMDTGGRAIAGLHRPVPGEHTGNLATRMTWAGTGPKAAFEVCSRGAESVRVRIAAVLPARARVVTRNASGGNPRDDWDGADISDAGADGAWLPAQQGECLRVETHLPAGSNPSDVSLDLRSIAHRFDRATRDQGAVLQKRAEQQTGKAELTDVEPRHGPSVHSVKCGARYASTCDYRSAAVDRHRSMVAHYHFESGGGSYFCTGTVLNDGRGLEEPPLFLTAAHCVATATEAESMDLAFDWEYRSCSRYWNGTSRARLLATAREFDQTLVRLHDWPDDPADGSRWAAGWDATESSVREGRTVYTLSHPGGAPMAYTRSHITGVATRPVNVKGYGLVYNAIRTYETLGITEPGSSGAAMMRVDPTKGMQAIGVLSHGPEIEPVCEGLIPATAGYGRFQDFFPRIARYLDPGSGTQEDPEHEYTIPLVLRDNPSRHGFIRLSSLSTEEGLIRITGIDDNGRRRGPTEVTIEAGESLHFNSGDLEQGSPAKGFARGFGAPSAGHWRLHLASTVPLMAHGYVRTADGFLTSVSEGAVGVTSDDGDGGTITVVPIMNPGSNLNQESLLRMTNRGARTTTVTAQLWDDGGAGPAIARYTVAPGRTRQVTAQTVERDASRDGRGKWKALVTASPDVPLTVMSVIDTRTGHISNVSR